jgi:hypothetical protein
MTQRDRDRLIALKKAKNGLITQRQAAEEIGPKRTACPTAAGKAEERGRSGNRARTPGTSIQPQIGREVPGVRPLRFSGKRSIAGSARR